jgi:predicted Fe-Mo cluster-binding NifX family protein
MLAVRDAGLQAARKVIDSHADGLITGHCGPKAYNALKAAGVTVYKVCDGSVADALDRFAEGELAAVTAADADMVIGRNSGLEQCNS